MDGKVIQASPEFEDCVQRGLEAHVPLADIVRIVQLSSEQLLENRPRNK
jgi:uncharacterized protein (DUF111 family)